jgi:tRNA(Leu) C34 or U34 (ribose-2'-O)-methylase TrmL
MSSRSFRRLQRDDPFAITITGEEEGDISDDDDISTWRHGGAADNPFITLSGDDPHQPDEEEDEGNDGDDGNDRTSSVPRQSVKKKKKKKKKQKRIVVSTTSSVDEVDEAVREVSQMLGGLETLGRPQEVDMPSNNSRVKPLLIIDRRCLNADNEMRRIFGARVVRGEQMRYSKAAMIIIIL